MPAIKTHPVPLPRTTPSTPTTLQTKPYSRPCPEFSSASSGEGDIKPKPHLCSPFELKPNVSTSNQKSKSNRAARQARPWSADELKALFRYAIKNGAPGGDSGWEGVIDGRTGSQCRNAWRHRIVGLIEKALEEKSG